MVGYFFRGQMRYFPDISVSLPSGAEFDLQHHNLANNRFWISIQYAETERQLVVYWSEMLDDIASRITSEIPDIINDMYTEAIDKVPIRSGKLADEFVAKSVLQIDIEPNKTRLTPKGYLHPEYPYPIANASHVDGEGWTDTYQLKNPIPALPIKSKGGKTLYKLHDVNAKNDYIAAWSQACISHIQARVYQAYAAASYLLQVAVEEQLKGGYYDDDTGMLQPFSQNEPSPFIEIGRIASSKYRIRAMQGAKIFINGSNLNVSYGKFQAQFKGVQLP